MLSSVLCPTRQNTNSFVSESLVWHWGYWISLVLNGLFLRTSLQLMVFGHPRVIWQKECICSFSNVHSTDLMFCILCGNIIFNLCCFVGIKILWFCLNLFVFILIFSVDCFIFPQDELLAELDELQQEELDKNLLEIGGSENVPLPNVPSTSLPSRPGKSLTISCKMTRSHLTRAQKASANNEVCHSRWGLEIRADVIISINSHVFNFCLFSVFTWKSQERGGGRRHGGPAALGNGSHVDAASATGYLHQRWKRKAQCGNEWTDEMLCMSVFLCLRRAVHQLYVTLQISKNAVFSSSPDPLTDIDPWVISQMSHAGAFILKLCQCTLAKAPNTSNIKQ